MGVLLEDFVSIFCLIIQFDPGVKYLVKKELCIFKAETDIGSSFDESSALSDFDIEGDIEDRDSACKEV